jgi:cytosine deaminase
LLDRAHLLAYRTDAATDADLELAYDLCSRAGAELLNLKPAAPLTDDGADRIDYPGECLAQVVVDRPKPVRVVRDGRVIARDGALAA